MPNKVSYHRTEHECGKLRLRDDVNMELNQHQNPLYLTCHDDSPTKDEKYFPSMVQLGSQLSLLFRFSTRRFE